MFMDVFDKDYTKEEYEEQFAIKISKHIDKLKRIEKAYEEEDVPDRFSKHVKFQHARLLEARDKSGKDVISPFDFTTFQMSL